MKQFSISLIVLSFIILAISCKKQQDSALSENEIKFDTIRSVKTYFLDNDSTKPSCSLKLVFEYPVEYKNSAILDSIQKLFVSAYIGENFASLPVKEAFSLFENEYVENYKEDADSFYKEERLGHDDADEYFSYFETITNTIKFNKGGLLSFQVNDSGRKASNATSFLALKNYVVNLETGLLLTEDDIFIPEYVEAFTKIFQDYLLKTNNVTELGKLEDLGYYGLEEMIPNNNFLLDDKGITYIFNKGDYSILKKEPIEIFIPYKDVEQLLKDGSPVLKFVTD